MVTNSTSTSVGSASTPAIVEFAFSQERCNEAFAKLVIQKAWPFNIFDDPQWTNVVQTTLQPRYEHVSGSTLKRIAMKLWKTAKQDLVKLFENLNTSVSLTTDVWSAPHGLPGFYLCVTAHWIQPETWQMMKRTIAFENFAYPHTGQDLFYILRNVMRYYKIKQKVFSISFDNATNNTNVVEKLKLRYNPCLDGKFYHSRCIAHLINLVVQDALAVQGINDIKTLFKKMLQEVFCGGKARYMDYIKSCKETNSPFLIPCWEIPTRWNSTYEMFRCALHQKSCLKRFHGELFRTGRVTSQFMDESWATIEKLCDLFEVFKDATTLLSGVYYPTSHLVIYQIWLICQKLAEFQGDIFDTMVINMKSKLKTYFKDMPPVLTCAAALNPCLNVSGVELLIQKLSIDLGLYLDDEFFAMNAKDTFNQQFKALFQVYFEKYGSTNASSSSSLTPTRHMTDSEVKLYNLVREANIKRAGESSSANTSEFEWYTESNFLATIGYEEFNHFDILSWWKARESQFPVLAAMARDLLSVQASTVALESAFSFSGRVLSIRRTRLTPASLEMCICLKDHLDAQERVQDTSNLEDTLDFDQDVHNEEVEEDELISLSDEEIDLDEAMQANSEEDQD